MPKRTDIKKILIIGSGPIVIGQACEFDYSGTQACKALRAEGYEVVLVNSNPATIMTGPEFADRTYIEPLTAEYLDAILAHERPDAVLPTVGGQTALNLAVELAEKGILDRYNVQLIGASLNAIKMAEDRLWFKDAMTKIGLDVARSVLVNNIEAALKAADQLGFPLIIRPSFTLGGTGSGTSYNREDFEEAVRWGLELSPVHEVLVEEAVRGWKEFELEVMRDNADNAVVVCSIENFDPMGVHTGDSITVAPVQTLTDKEYQTMRDAAFAVIRAVGVETGGSNIQFAVDPRSGRMVVIEMNPRFSRSSALASNAAGFPIAKIAARLAMGYRLDEIPNDITKKTPSCFEPSIDYVVAKIPKWAQEKFPESDHTLGTQMKSVGEVMAIGRTFKEALLKGMRSLETGRKTPKPPDDPAELLSRLAVPHPQRLWDLFFAFQAGYSVESLEEITHIDPWFLDQLEQIVEMQGELKRFDAASVPAPVLREAKRFGLSDAHLGEIWGAREEQVYARRQETSVRPVFKRVDTCAAEFESFTPYLYSTYESEDESEPTQRKKVMILGSGPNRIGQGIEFDYCCVHAALAMREDGYETIMVNCNPETVSTDYDTSDRLYFEPLTLEDVLEVIALEQPKGVIVQYGGQTPLKLARDLEAAGAPIIGTTPDSIDLAEDRERFQKMIDKLGLRQPPNRTARNPEDAVRLAEEIGYPLVVRPSYVLGGRAMEIVFNEAELRTYMRDAVKVSNESPVLLDRFLDDAVEVDVDAICDGTDVLIGGIMEHIEQAGVHSGDSACSLPPYNLTPAIQDELRDQIRAMAKELKVIGLMNTQFAIKGDKVYVLEVNPRASRTVPFVSKATGVALAKVAARCMVGNTLSKQGVTREVVPAYHSVKEAVFPFIKFPGVDPILGPEMKSTGEVMGIGRSFAEAYYKSQLGAGIVLPKGGKAFVSVRDADKAGVVPVCRYLVELGFELLVTRGTGRTLEEAGVPFSRVNKVTEDRPHIVDMIKNDEISFIVNTTEDKQAIADSFLIRREALQHKVTYTTTLAGALATAKAMMQRDISDVNRIQDLHLELVK